MASLWRRRISFPANEHFAFTERSGEHLDDFEVTLDGFPHPRLEGPDFNGQGVDEPGFFMCSARLLQRLILLDGGSMRGEITPIHPRCQAHGDDRLTRPNSALDEIASANEVLFRKCVAVRNRGRRGGNHQRCQDSSHGGRYPVVSWPSPSPHQETRRHKGAVDSHEQRKPHQEKEKPGPQVVPHRNQREFRPADLVAPSRSRRLCSYEAGSTNRIRPAGLPKSSTATLDQPISKLRRLSVTAHMWVGPRGIHRSFMQGGSEELRQ